MTITINRTDYIQADYYDGNYQAALTPTIEEGEKVAAQENADARQWADVTRAAKAAGCALEWDDVEVDEDGDEWDIYVATPCDEYRD